jgi:4-amino-4-deoxy-L-arabinose transferase-like glycosyltransferase
VLLAAGLLAYLAAKRSFAPLWPLRPFLGIAVMAAATAGLMALIYLDAGYDAVREWFWVNHVQRFVDPQGTGHARPFYQYFEYLPSAIFPWLLPFIALFKPANWRNGAPANHNLRLYLAMACVGMFLILSASTTKRALYLMPMLPPLFLLLANQAVTWWQSKPQGRLGGFARWLQVGLVALFALAPTIVTLAYLRIVDTVAIVLLLVIAALVAGVILFSRRGDQPKAIATLATTAVAGLAISLLVAFPHVGASMKDITPFLMQVKPRLADGEPAYVTGRIARAFAACRPVLD